MNPSRSKVETWGDDLSDLSEEAQHNLHAGVDDGMRVPATLYLTPDGLAVMEVGQLTDAQSEMLTRWAEAFRR